MVLRHDLDGRVDSSARDADLADRDYSAEIMNDGAPDGARWLGLDRRSFLSTACVRQTSILQVLDDPGDLQDELQRAAANARTGETAADALGLLNDYRAEHVGTERAWTRPLATSRQEARNARSALTSAENARDEATARRRSVDALAARTHDLERERDATRAVLLEAAAGSAEQQLARAGILSEAFPEGEPRHPADDGELAEQVTRALEQWSNAPHPQEPSGPTADELRLQLAEEDFGLAILAEADAAALEERLARAHELSAAFPDGAPRRPSEEDELTQEVANSIAAWENRPTVSGTPVSELRTQLDELNDAQGATEPGGFIGLLRAIIRWFARLFSADSQEPDPGGIELDERRRNIEREIEDATRIEDALSGIRNAVRAAGLADGSPDAMMSSLREWQQMRAKQMQEADERRAGWEQLQRVLGEQRLDEVEVGAVGARLDAESRAAATDHDRLARVLAEPLDDTQLAELRSQTTAAGRTETESRLRMREEQDARFHGALVARDEAATGLRNAAAAIGSDAGGPDGQESALIQWLERRREILAEDRRKTDEWDELQRLLGEKTLASFEEETETLRREADSRVASSLPEEITKARERGPSEGDLEALETELEEARARRDTAQGELTEFESGLPDVAEAEERVARGEAEVARVEGLDRTLGTAIKFLEAAQERVHRDIAPVLRATVLERLEEVTGGRYPDCRIDPEFLQVEVADTEGRWRTAQLLSHGTAEQLYLLLRVALARHLTEPTGEACPLILDDVLSAADNERKQQLLQTLLSISESTQVILFTHEDNVRSWAEARLTGASDRLTVLAGEAPDASA
ncbi:MAG: hypothetical protein OXH97_03330 [Chloroflexota bacterium]|nr:hypothetical protein [Chloroflexota bacterium]